MEQTKDVVRWKSETEFFCSRKSLVSCMRSGTMKLQEIHLHFDSLWFCSMISMVCEYNMGDDENVSLAMSHPAMSCYLDVSNTNVPQRKCLFYVSFCHFRHLSFVICHSSFVIHISGSEKLILSFVIQHLSFVIHHSKSLMEYHFITLSFVVCHSSFVIHSLNSFLRKKRDSLCICFLNSFWRESDPSNCHSSFNVQRSY